ncbi:MAG: polyphosphate kinase 1 [Vicinamibacterales bacterium]
MDDSPIVETPPNSRARRHRRVGTIRRPRGARERQPAPDAAAPAPAVVQVDPADLANPALYINRELSWLEFNQRVLDQARDPAHPLLERVKFLAIVGSNLDEFFMVRVATLLRKYRSSLEDVAPDGSNTEVQLAAIRRRAGAMMAEQTACWTNELRPALAAERIHFLEIADYTDAVREYLAGVFAGQIYPALTPLAFDPGHPFPFISNLSKNLAVVVRHHGQTKFARIKIPDKLPRFVALPESIAPSPGATFVFLEDVIKSNISRLFPASDIEGAHLFRIIRDTDMVIQEDEADDLLETVDRSLKQLRYGALSMLRVDADMPRRVLDILIENFEVEEDVVFHTSDRLGYADWKEITKLHRPQLKDVPFSPRGLWPAEVDADWMFGRIRERDEFVHHPFDSFSAVEGFLRAAVEDASVIAIKMTLYRIGDNSPLIDLLIRAAEEGKQVAVLVELKARFDERNNIVWANRLESAGIHVVYGPVALKTHCKLCLVVRKETDTIRCYAHVGTGNYNRATATVYTDFGLFTARQAIIEDILELFNDLTGYPSKRPYRELLVAPLNLRTSMRALIEREADHARAGRPARIIVKNNAVADPGMIKAFYAASEAGVDIDMIVRGVCCLRPGIPGISDRIRVRSIVGRFLEHSRIYVFANGGDEQMFIGSADLMERNLDRRVEVLCPVHDPAIREHLRRVVLESYLADDDRAKLLTSDGTYVHASGAPPRTNAHDTLVRWYTSRP